MKVLIWFLLFLMLLIFAFLEIDRLAELGEGKHSTLLYVSSVLASIFLILICSWGLYLLWFHLN